MVYDWELTIVSRQLYWICKLDFYSNDWDRRFALDLIPNDDRVHSDATLTSGLTLSDSVFCHMFENSLRQTRGVTPLYGILDSGIHSMGYNLASAVFKIQMQLTLTHRKGDLEQVIERIVRTKNEPRICIEKR